MASIRPQSSVNPASASPDKSANPSPAATAAPATPAPTAIVAPATSAPATNVAQQSQPPSVSPSQRASTTQAAKSSPTGTTSPSKNSQNGITRSNASPASKPFDASSNDVSTPDLPPPSGSHAAVWGAVIAVLGIIITLVACFWLLRRRREKSRRLWDAQRMPASNFFGKYGGETIPEKPGSIEATLAADLARLRNLDQQRPIDYQNRDGGFSKQSLDFSPNPTSPAGFKIARKPSLRVRDPTTLLPPSVTRDDLVDLTAPAYNVKEYIGDSSSKENRLTTQLSPSRNPDFY